MKPALRKLEAARRAGVELVRDGMMNKAALAEASRALVTRKEWFG